VPVEAISGQSPAQPPSLSHGSGHVGARRPGRARCGERTGTAAGCGRGRPGRVAASFGRFGPRVAAPQLARDCVRVHKRRRGRGSHRSDKPIKPSGGGHQGRTATLTDSFRRRPHAPRATRTACPRSSHATDGSLLHAQVVRRVTRRRGEGSAASAEDERAAALRVDLLPCPQARNIAAEHYQAACPGGDGRGGRQEAGRGELRTRTELARRARRLGCSFSRSQTRLRATCS